MSVELLYYRSRSLLRKGDIATASWGRLILGTGPNHPSYFSEYLLERIRREAFPDKPSRLDAVFAFEDAQFASKWTHPGREREYLYIVTTDVEQYHRGDITWIDKIRDYRTFEGVEECARNYWSGQSRGPDQWERVIPGTLTIVDRISKIPENGAME